MTEKQIPMKWFQRRHEDGYKQAAIDYPRKLHGDRKAYLYTKPFGTDPWGDDFCGKLHDFAHLVEMFRLPPGASLHHFEDERAVLRNVFAHLKPGGRLFMKEPQARHPDAPETRAEVAESGVLERGFTREQLVTSLTEAGFLPAVILRQADMMLDEGRLAPGYIGAVMASTPVYHLLLAAKPGPGAIDSRWPGTLDAALSVAGLPPRLGPGTSIDVEVTATNTGDTLWLHQPMRYGGHVRLGAQLLAEDRLMVAPDFASLFMPRDVAPGESITLRVPMRAPDVAGRYILRFDLVDEFITWFRDRGSRPCDASVDVA